MMGWRNLQLSGVGILLVASTVPAEGQVLPGRERRVERRQAATEAYPDLSWRLQNPLARIIVLPTSAEYREGGGTGDGQAFSYRFAPRLPFVLNEDWHLISKTDVAWVSQQDVVGTSEQDGLSDLVQTFFFSPNRSLAWDLYWGAGPSLILPTATDDFLGTEKFSVGPTVAIFRQRKDWTAGITLSHVWSVAGPSGAPDVSLSRIEPLLAFTAPTSTTIALGAELSYDWENEVWRGPLVLRLSQLSLIRERPVQWGLGLEHFAMDDDDSEPEWGAFLRVSFPLESPRWGAR